MLDSFSAFDQLGACPVRTNGPLASIYWVLLEQVMRILLCKSWLFISASWWGGGMVYSNGWCKDIDPQNRSKTKICRLKNRNLSYMDENVFFLFTMFTIFFKTCLQYPEQVFPINISKCIPFQSWILLFIHMQWHRIHHWSLQKHYHVEHFISKHHIHHWNTCEIPPPPPPPPPIFSNSSYDLRCLHILMTGDTGLI